MRFRLISLLALIFLFQNLALASHLSSPKVSDYLQAKVSDSINDYKSTIKFYQKLHKHNPRDTVIINKLLMASILDGDLLNANAYAFRLANVSCSPSITTSCVKIQSDISHLVNGISYLNSYKYDLADQSFSNILNGQFSSKTFVALLKAWVWVNKNNLERSMGEIDTIGANEDLYLALVHKALIYDYVDQIDVALIYYEQAMEMQRDLYVLNMYYNFLKRNNFSNRINSFQDNYLKNYDTDFQKKFLNGNRNRILQNPLHGLGIVLFNAQGILDLTNFDLTHVLYQLSIETSPNLHEIKYVFSSFLNQLQEHKKARQILKQIPKTHYLSNYATIQISDSYGYQDDNASAISNLINHSQNDSNFEISLSLGNYYRYEKEWEKALSAYNNALIIGEEFNKKDLWEIYFNIGIVYERSDNWDLAEVNFIKALDMSSEQADVLNYLAYSYIDKGINLAESKNMIEKALMLKPNDPYIVDSLAWYYYKIGAYEEALSILEFSMETMPYDSTVNDHYGDILWKLGKEIEARYYWKKAINLDKENIYSDNIRSKLLIGI